VRIYLSYSEGPHSFSPCRIENVSLSIDAPRGILIETRNLVIPEIAGGGNATPRVLHMRLRVSKTIIPNSDQLTLVAAYRSAKGEPRTTSTTCTLPLSISAKVVPPKKNAQVWFTLDTNRPPPALTDLFDDVIKPACRASAEVARHAANTMTLECYAEQTDCTVLVSKKGGSHHTICGVNAGRVCWCR
jgi:hypothetical protein